MKKIEGKIITKFAYNPENDEMVCYHRIVVDKDETVPFGVILRTYASLGAKLHKINQEMRYGITNDDDNEKAVQRIEGELGIDKEVTE